MCAGQPTFCLGESRALLGIIEQDDDLVLFDWIALLRSDPANNTHEAWTQFDSLAINDVAARG